MREYLRRRAKCAAQAITAPVINQGATDESVVISSRPIFPGEKPAPPIVAMINSVEIKNAIGGLTAFVNEVPGRPRYRPPRNETKIARPVKKPTFVNVYSKASKIKMRRNCRTMTPGTFNHGPFTAFDLTPSILLLISHRPHLKSLQLQ